MGRISVYPDVLETVSQDIGHPPGHHGGLSCTSLSLTRRRNWLQSADATAWPGSTCSAQRRAAPISIRRPATPTFWWNSTPTAAWPPFDQFFDLAEALSMTLGRPVGLVESRAQSTIRICTRPSIDPASLSMRPDLAERIPRHRPDHRLPQRVDSWLCQRDAQASLGLCRKPLAATTPDRADPACRVDTAEARRITTRWSI